MKLANMNFKLEEDLLKSPTSGNVGALRKSNLLGISAHFKLGTKPAMRKFQILRIALKHFVDEGIFDQDVLDLVKEEPSDQLLVRKLEMELELGKIEKEKGEEKEIELRRLGEEEMEVEFRKLEIEKEIGMKTLEMLISFLTPFVFRNKIHQTAATVQ